MNVFFKKGLKRSTVQLLPKSNTYIMVNFAVGANFQANNQRSLLKTTMESCCRLQNYNESNSTVDTCSICLSVVSTGLSTKPVT